MGNHIPTMPYNALIEIFHLKTVNEFNEFLLDTCRTMCTNVMDHPCNLNTYGMVIKTTHVSLDSLTMKSHCITCVTCVVNEIPLNLQKIERTNGRKTLIGEE